MDLHFPPQNWTDFGAFFAFMFLVMLAFYFLGKWAHTTKYSKQIYRLADFLEAIQNKVAHRAYRGTLSMNESLNHLRGWPFNSRK
ncbi:hypothetical protein ACYVMA_003052 [Vibrio parahaemolyticus]